jgi:hypothetical protein
VSLLLLSNDNFSIGPISELNQEKGQKSRYEWLKTCFHEEDVNNFKEIYLRAIQQINLIPKEIPIYIWVSENAHEQTGLLFTMNLLKERTNNIFIINSTQQYKELFKEKAKKYIPRSFVETLIEDLKVIYQYAKESKQPVTKKQRQEMVDEWVYITKNETTLRIWNNGELKSVSEDYYDEYIVTKAKKLHKKNKGFINAARLIGEVVGHLDQFVGDGFIEYRLRQLIEAGVLEYEGNLDGMIFYRVKLR